jgi:membrane-bound ClpP family serine protease
MKRTRLIIAIVSTIFELLVMLAVVLWGLPQLDVYVPVWALIPVMIIWVVYSVYTYRKGSKVLYQKSPTGLPDMIGTRGKTVGHLDPEGWVKIRGELWSASSVSGAIKPDTDIIVTGQYRLKLTVRAVDNLYAVNPEP